MADGEKQKKPSRALLIGLTAFLLWAIGAAIVVTMVVYRPPDFSESPVTSRNNPGYADGSRVGVLEPLSLPPQSGHPASQVFGKPVRIDGTDNNFVLHWQGEPETALETLPERMVPALVGDDAIELVAFATWMPQPDDETHAIEVFDPDRSETTVEVTNGDWKAPLTFRDPATLETLSIERLDELRIPESFREVAPPQHYMTGVIRLLFRTKNMEAVRFVGGAGGDTVTESVVTYSLDSLDDGPDQESAGEWARYDLALLLWHDKELTFHVQVLTGEPVYAELPQQLGEQVNFGEALRLQWLAREPGLFNGRFSDVFTPQPQVDLDLLKEISKPNGDLDSLIAGQDGAPVLPPTVKTSTRLNAASKSPSANPKAPPTEYRIYDDFAAHVGSRISTTGTTTPETFLRTSNDEYLNHLGRIEEDGSITWDFSGASDREQIHFASCKHTQNASDPLRLVFLPQLTELTFKVAGMPDLPNPRNIEDLFDQRIPRLTLTGEDPGDAEGELMEFIGVATQTAVDHTDVWNDGWPDSFPEDHTFRDTSPQLLLNWYLKTSREAFIEHDPDAHLLLVNQEEESWWTKLIDFVLQR